MGCLERIVHVFYSVAHGYLHVNLCQFLDEEVAVFGVHNGFYACAEHFYTIFFKNTRQIEFGTAVEGCLTAECQQDAIRTFFLDDFCYEIRIDGLKIHFVGNAFRGLDSGNVWIYQYR